MKNLFLAFLLFLAGSAYAVDGTPTSTPTPTPSRTITRTNSPTPTSTNTFNLSDTVTTTPTSTNTPTATSTVTPTATRTQTLVVVTPVVIDPTVKREIQINAQGTPVPMATTYKPFASISVSGTGAAWTPASGKKFILLGFCMGGSVVGDYILFDGSNTVAAYSQGVAATNGCVPLPGMGYRSTAANNVLKIKGPVAATTPNTATGQAYGTEE